MKRIMILMLALVAVAALGFAGCGGNDDNDNDSADTTTTGTATQTTDTTASDKITIEMGDYFFKPDNVTVPAGKVTITAPNTGTVEHELVLLKTNQDPAKLKTESDGEVEEDAYNVVGEMEAETGETAKKTFNLKPGKYAMICNLPGHYKKGMYGSLTVE